MAPADPNMVPAALFSVKVLSVTSRLGAEDIRNGAALGDGADCLVVVHGHVEDDTAPVLSRPPPRVTGPMGPSTVASVARPLEIAKSRSSTSLSLPLTLKTRLASLPLTVKRLAPGPSRIRSSVMLSSPLVKVMVPSPPRGRSGSGRAPGWSLASRIA